MSRTPLALHQANGQPVLVPERFLKLSEVRQRLGVSRSTVWRWTNEQGLKVVRVGGVTRIRESDLQAFLKRHETESHSPEVQRVENAA